MRSPARFRLVRAAALVSCFCGGAPAPRRAAAESPAEITWNEDGAVMRLVPAGKFLMGSAADQFVGEVDEHPQWEPEVPAFYIDVHEVTNARYAKFCVATRRPFPVHWKDGNPPPGQGFFPVTNVTWFDADAYATWAGKRLPTELEWEKAARGTDGRTFCWGNDEDPKCERYVGEKHERPRAVGSLPAGASPYGIQDLLGNAWEWTADWYGPYPGSAEPSIHYGKKYKVMRGGGYEGFYGAWGARCADRSRLLPYGAYDSLGFRCAVDAGGLKRDVQKDPDDDPARWMKKIEAPAAAAVPKPPVRLTVAETAGEARRGEIVTSGVPFPPGALKKAQVLVRDDAGKSVPAQASATATWQDGSVRWLLVDFPATLDPNQTRQYVLEPREVPKPGEGAAFAHEARASDGPGGVTIVTGPLRVFVPKDSAAPLGEVTVDRNGDCTVAGEAPVVKGGLAPVLRLSAYKGPALTEETSSALPYRATGHRGNPLAVVIKPPETVEIEENGPARVAVRTEGWAATAEDGNVVRYTFRIWAFAGSADLRVWYTFTHYSGLPMLMLDEAGLALPVDAGADPEVRIGGGAGDYSGRVGPQGAAVVQEALGAFGEDTAYRCEGGVQGKGFRAPGWIDLRGAAAGVTLGARHFWEQYPKRLGVAPGLHGGAATLDVGLWVGDNPFYLDRGIAKTHELWLSFHDGKADAAAAHRRRSAPLFAAATPAWYCASGAFDEQEPADYDAYPFFESSIDGEADRWLKSGPWGMRDFGDSYMAGGKKGKNAFNNLEYDGSYQSFQQFFRTGLLKHLDLGIRKARHQEDIDSNHVTGHPWKHGPRHTSTEAEGGHLFVRGMIAHHHLTGERRGLEVAREIGDYMANQLNRSKPHGNERQIGWTLYAQAAVYEATWDEKYRKSALHHIHELVDGMDARGKFDIRWDNRISFFNGATGSAFLVWHRLTGDAKAREGARRHMERALGYYPEYAGRTQWAFGLLAADVRDARFLDAAERSWETTLDFYAQRSANVGQNQQQYLDLRRRFGLTKPAGKAYGIPPQYLYGMPGFWRRSFYNAKAAWLLENPGGKPMEIAVVRLYGRGEGTARVLDGAGKTLAEVAFPAGAETAQQKMATVGGEGVPAVYRVECDGQKTLGWEVVTPAPVRSVLHLPGWQNARALPGRIWFEVPKEAKRVRFKLESADEGYHGATIYDPEGRASASATRFIDLGDAKAYVDEVTAEVGPGQGGGLWSVDLRDARVVEVEGAAEYVASLPLCWFKP